MPYQNRRPNRRNQRKRYYNRNSKFNQQVATAGNVARTATAAMGAAKLALSLINPEFKYLDVDVTTTQLLTTYQKKLLNGCQKGTGSSNRIGRSIKMKSIDIGILVTRNVASTTNNFVRCSLVYDSTPNGTTIVSPDVFESSSNVILSPRNLDFRSRFIILKEWVFDIGNAGNRPAVHSSFYKQLDMHAIYNDSDLGTIADMEKGSLYLMYVSDASTNGPQFTFYSRIRYLDN